MSILRLTSNLLKLVVIVLITSTTLLRAILHLLYRLVEKVLVVISEWVIVTVLLLPTALVLGLSYCVLLMGEKVTSAKPTLSK